MDVKEIFINQLSLSKEVTKEDIFKVIEELGLEANQRIAKSRMINMIVDHGGYEKLFEYFNEFITIPYWQVADFYGLSSQQLDRLKDIGVIKQQPIVKRFYNNTRRQYYDADTYPLSIFEYSEQELKQAYDKAYSNDIYSIRVETRTKQEVNKLISILEGSFNIETQPQSYEHRNGQGYYTYLKIKKLNGSIEEQNRFMKEINDLNKKIENMKEDHREELVSMYKLLETYLGEVRNKVEVELKLQHLIKGKEIKKNTRGAGRKPKFDKNKILEMEIMKENGYSYNDIAKEFGTTKVTVIKYLKNKK